MSGSRRCGGRRPAVVGDNSNGYVETDPTGRYGRFDELLGKGAMKSVYRGFDEERGVEVAWNQAYLSDVLRTRDAVERMYSEVQLLSTLRHDAIIGFHASWVDVARRTFNFITELFSSGTLRSYRLCYPRVSLRAVRSWGRQILRGLAYLHAHDPPVIHRDLKCDNILVNGHQGQVKIADLGLAAVLRHQPTAHSVIGTPEFMAPEMYDEEYDERVDVYSFGMCMIEMLTVEYPYSECSNPAQIYKKVTAGKLPEAFYRVQDEEARRFIGRCLVAASRRPSAAELLMDPFLLDDHHHHSNKSACAVPVTVPPPSSLPAAAAAAAAPRSASTCRSTSDVEEDAEHPHVPVIRTDMTITGKLNAEEDTIFLKVQIADQTADAAGNNVRNIYFPFDMASDTAMEVAEEMVKELEITDRDPLEIAAMIEQEIERLLPGRQQQHEYSVCVANGDDDDENEERPPPFYYLSSSPTSSHGGSLYGGVGSYASGGYSGSHGGGWSKDHWYACLSDDDDMSSMHSSKYSALHYASGNEEEGQPKNIRFGRGERSSSRSPGREDTAHQLSLARQLQRQCSLSPHAGRPRRREDVDHLHGHHHHGRTRNSNNNRVMTRNRSMVDLRSQLLHRTLVEELNRRLFFNTVGAVENIGFRAPATTSSSSSARGRRGKDDKHHQQYVML